VGVEERMSPAKPRQKLGRSCSTSTLNLKFKLHNYNNNHHPRGRLSFNNPTLAIPSYVKPLPAMGILPASSASPYIG
jgi:hypothetical protein